MCLVRSDSLRRNSLQGMRTYGVLFFFAGSVFHTLCIFFAASNVPLSQWSIMRSGYAWVRSNMLACQQSMISVQHRLRLTMRHVYGHGGNLGNECADHAAALGTFGITSCHNVSTRWIHNNFDASVCFDGCNNISEVLERLQHSRTDATSIPPDRS